MYPIYDWQKRVLFHTFKFLSLNGTPKDVFGCILNVWFSFNEISKFIVDWEKEKERIKRNQKGNFDVNKDFILEAQFQNGKKNNEKVLEKKREEMKKEKEKRKRGGNEPSCFRFFFLPFFSLFLFSS